MSLPTWGQLVGKYCSRRFNVDSENPYYEDFSIRRYNYATSMDKDRFRFVFLKDVIKDKSNKTALFGVRTLGTRAGTTRVLGKFLLPLIKARKDSRYQRIIFCASLLKSMLITISFFDPS